VVALAVGLWVYSREQGLGVVVEFKIETDDLGDPVRTTGKNDTHLARTI
jgi:hypothetical protein